MSSAEPDDHELIKRITRGDQNAADIFVDRYKGLIYSILKRDYRFSDDVAKDLFQDFCERLCKDNYRVLRMWRGQSKLSAFLAVIVHNLARDYLRSQRQTTGKDPPGGSSEPQDLPGSEKDDPAHVALLREVQRAVREAREKLGPRDQELIHLKHDLDLSHKEIADQMELTVNRAGVCLYRAERRLGKILRAKFPDLFEK